MKKRYVIASLLVGMALSTSAVAKFVFDCTNKDGSYGYMYDNNCHACPKGQELGKDGKCYDTTKKCTSNQYIVNGTCMPCPPKGTCDGTNVKCPYGYIKSNGAVSCNTAPGVNPSCSPGSVFQGPSTGEGKCVAVTDSMCGNGKIASTDSTGRLVCTDKKCTVKQYLAGTLCRACPANATCDGVNAKCNSGYQEITKNPHTVICAAVGQVCTTKQYRVDKTCVACPKLGTCDGDNVKCPYGYTKDKKGYVTCNPAPTCKSNQYIVNNKCMTCPANATCNGKTATCKKGMVTTNQNGKITCKAKQCKQGSHESISWIRKRYPNCKNCKAETVNACSKNKKPHKHYSCECDC